jgi:site-specific DNA recombinase
MNYWGDRKMATQKAAIYLRSSKDRNDVSIDSQKRELEKLAMAKELHIVAEYKDAVESAKSENRPDFQRLLRDLKDRRREWSYLLLVDTSRLSRNQYHAHMFNHEAQKRGVSILYSKIPETNPVVDVVILSVMRAFDEFHSLMSKEKGLAGMAENVKQGFRAGGRAPRGYKLKKIETGATREGNPVTKSKLEPNEDAPIVARYLKGRASGSSRRNLKRSLGIEWGDTSLIGYEWNSLTYAGHTVWNVRHEKSSDGGYKGRVKMRPRSEWDITENTHEALITDAEAEAILTSLENSNHSKSRKTPAKYLLTGMLKTADGDPWYGDGPKRNAYRLKKTGKNRTVAMDDVDNMVIEQIVTDMTSPSFVKALFIEARKHQEATAVDPTKDVRHKLMDLEKKISRMINMASQLENPAPALREVDELEAQRGVMKKELGRLEMEYSANAVLANITEDQIGDMLKGISQDMKEMDKEILKDQLSTIVDKIILDPESLELTIHYRIPVESQRNRMASPGGVEPPLPA